MLQKLADAQKKQDEERKKVERKQRHMQDDLRYALKKLSEPLDVNMSYEDVYSFSILRFGAH
jgi:pre-mRNA-processing factor 40